MQRKGKKSYKGFLDEPTEKDFRYENYCLMLRNSSSRQLLIIPSTIKMNYVLLFSLLFLNALNVILHSIGAYLLLSLYATCKYKIQQIYLIHLSISECLINFLEIVRTVLDLINLNGDAKLIAEEIRHYTLILSFTGISVVYYFDMIYLTLDKLMDIVLNIKYPIYWNEHKTKRLLGVTWFLGILSSIIVSFSYKFLNFKWEPAFFKYFYPPIEITFILLAFVTYAFIFRKYTQAHRNLPGTIVSLDSSIDGRKRNAFQLFRRSRFYIAVLLIITFLLFFVVPDLTYLSIAVIQKKKSEILTHICWICYAISNLADAYIYIFVQDKVRRTLLKKLPFCGESYNEKYISYRRDTHEKQIASERLKRKILKANTKCVYTPDGSVKEELANKEYML